MLGDKEANSYIEVVISDNETVHICNDNAQAWRNLRYAKFKRTDIERIIERFITNYKSYIFYHNRLAMYGSVKSK